MKAWCSRRAREIVKQLEELWVESVDDAQTLKRGGQRTGEAECRGRKTTGEAHIEQQRDCDCDDEEKSMCEERVPDEVLCTLVWWVL